MDPLADTDFRELRIFLESVICDLCRFRHATRDGVAPAKTQIHQETRVGPGLSRTSASRLVSSPHIS